MHNKGYKSKTDRFLTKNFAESTNVKLVYYINITLNNEIITAITAYNKKNQLVSIPKSIRNIVQADIQDALKV